jgi:hypothetical protein
MEGLTVRVLQTFVFVLVSAASTLHAANPTTPHVVGPTEMQAAIASRVDDAAVQRATIQSLLSRPEVQRWAAEAGLDLERAKARAATLQGEDLQRLAQQARHVDAQLAGGDALVIGSTTIIIALLILILILVAT